MSPLSLLAAFACLFCLESGVRALVLNKGQRLNRIVFTLDLLLALWALDAAFDYSAPKSALLGLYLVASPAWNFFLPLILHLCISLPRDSARPRHVVLIALYSPAILFNALNVGAVLSGEASRPGALEPFLPPGPWRVLFWLYYATYALLSLAFLLRAFGRSRDPLERKRLGILTASLVVPFAGGAITDAVLPLLGSGLPDFGILWTMVWVAGVRYATLRFAFISPFTNIADSRRFFAAFLDHSRDGIVVTGPDGTILLWNRAMEDLTGRGTAEVLGSRLDLLDLPLGQVGGTWVFPFRRDGRERWLQASAFSFWLRAGRLAHGAIVRDISDEKAREAAERAEHERNEKVQRLEAVATLASGLAHEFNNILGGMRGTVSLLKLGDGVGGPPSVEEVDEGLDRIDRAAIRGGDLVRQLLALGGRPAVERRRVCLRGALDQALARVGADLDASVRIVAEGPFEEAWVLAGESQVQQILFNLLVNAGDSMTTMRSPGEVRGGQVTVGLASGLLPLPRNGLPGLRAEAWIVTVADEGVGIAPEALPRVFDPFYTTKDEGTSQGLGLPAVRAIAEAHGGAAEARSVEGRGSEFRVYLPKAEGPA